MKLNLNPNQLLYNHQLAMLNAQQANSREGRDICFDLAGYYARRIAAWRQEDGLPGAGWPRDERPEWQPGL